jgi:hypothetical protein
MLSSQSLDRQRLERKYESVKQFDVPLTLAIAPQDSDERREQRDCVNARLGIRSPVFFFCRPRDCHRLKGALMALYGLSAVHLNPEGKIERAVMQAVDSTTNSWTGQAYEYEAHVVANMIATGDKIYPIFIVLGGTVSGPAMRIAVRENGHEGIELDGSDGRTAHDLVLF